MIVTVNYSNNELDKNNKQINKNIRLFIDKYRAEEPRYLWYCGTKKYRKGDVTWYLRRILVNIRIDLILPQTRVIGLHLRRHSMGLPSFKYGLRKTHVL